MTCIYTISYKGVVFYVGKTINPEQRFRQHIGCYGYGECVSYIRGLCKSEITFDIVDIINDTSYRAHDLESYWMQQFKRSGIKLKNMHTDMPHKKLHLDLLNVKHPAIDYLTRIS